MAAVLAVAYYWVEKMLGTYYVQFTECIEWAMNIVRSIKCDAPRGRLVHQPSYHSSLRPARSGRMSKQQRQQLLKFAPSRTCIFPMLTHSTIDALLPLL